MFNIYLRMILLFSENTRGEFTFHVLSSVKKGGSQWLPPSIRFDGFTNGMHGASEHSHYLPVYFTWKTEPSNARQTCRCIQSIVLLSQRRFF